MADFYDHIVFSNGHKMPIIGLGTWQVKFSIEKLFFKINLYPIILNRQKKKFRQLSVLPWSVVTVTLIAPMFMAMKALSETC